MSASEPPLVLFKFFFERAGKSEESFSPFFLSLIVKIIYLSADTITFVSVGVWESGAGGAEVLKVASSWHRDKSALAERIYFNYVLSAICITFNVHNPLYPFIPFLPVLAEVRSLSLLCVTPFPPLFLSPWHST